ncbi:sigma-70 family RNA polymerase sigma factor [Virgibacillus kimchii]
MVYNLIPEYKEGLKDLKRRYENMDVDDPDRKSISRMIGDMEYAIKWMKTGRRPGNLRGIERRSVYQRTSLIDMELMPSLDIEPEQRELTEDEKRAITDILIDLSHQERQCFLLHMAQGWSMQEIAEELKVSKSAVQIYIRRAKEKIKAKLEGG